MFLADVIGTVVSPVQIPVLRDPQAAGDAFAVTGAAAMGSASSA